MSIERSTEESKLLSGPEAVRDSRPQGGSWRADDQLGSRHSRWTEELRLPLEVRDADRAREICGQVSRLVLRDFAPALLLLSRLERRRLQAITAYSLTLLDFARQSGLDGERLTAINRWEFELENALEGRPVGQPVFVTLSALESERSWAREAFDLLHSYARRRSALPRPFDRRAAEKDSRWLARSLAWLLLGDAPADPVVEFAAALIRLRALEDLGDDLRRHRVRLPVTEVSDGLSPDNETDRRVLHQAIDLERRRLSAVFGRRPFHPQLPAGLRPAARYCRRTALELLAQIGSLGADVIQFPPSVGLLGRLRLLARARLF